MGTRFDLLRAIAALAPIIVVLGGPEAVAETIRAIIRGRQSLVSIEGMCPGWGLYQVLVEARSAKYALA
jgi:hypothetical protein